VNNLMEINLAIAGRARAGMALTAAEIDELAAADVLSLGMLADDVRRARVGDRVTFVRVHEWKPGEEPVPQAAREVRLTSLPDSLEGLTALIRAARVAAGARRLTGFSLATVMDRAQSGWGSPVEILARLKDAGLDAIVGAPVDLLSDAPLALGACLQTGLAVGCWSVQRPVGANRADLLIRMRTLASEFPGIKTIAPLPREQSTMVPTTGYDDVRMVALTRLVVSTVPHIQVDWSQYGPKLAQVALTFGADDLDRVSAVDDESVGRRRMAAEDVKRNIAAAGLVAIERDLPA
jgi:aminodeoxyfutalosine synthase